MHDEAPGSEEYDPTEHAIQLLDPLVLVKVPGGHIVQDVAVMLAEKVPALQFSHAFVLNEL